MDGSVLHATVEDADMNIDLALLKVNTKRKLPALDFAASDDVEVGEWVIALGSPLSLSHSVTAGVISSTNRAANELGLRNHAMEYIQTDASITFGNSGGPLVNLDGDVIGINNLRITAGISFAIPIAYAKKFLRNGRHPLGANNKSNHDDDTQQLGIATVQMTDIVIEELQLKESISGVFVWKVILDSPAFRSGLQAGDIITHINGMTINQVTDIYKKLKGGSVQLDIIRDAAINSERATLQLGQESVETPSVCAMTDDRPYVQRAAKGRSASICAATSTSMEAISPPTGGTPDAGTPISRRRRPATRSQSARITGGKSIRKRAAIVAAANNNAEVKSHCNSEPKLDQGEGTPEVSPNIRRKGSRRGTSVYHRKSAAFLDVPDTRNNIGGNEEDEDSYRLRSFSFTSKGKRIVNRGDSFRRRRSRSNSLCPPTMLSGGGSSPLPLEDELEQTQVTSYVVALLGANGVGKSALISQFMTSECINAYERQKDLGNQTVSIMLNGEESELSFVNIANSKEIDRTNPPDAFVVVYSVVDKASFSKAKTELITLENADLLRSRTVILAGNKIDLARSRAVSTQDGKCLACTYRAKFIEISVGINHNVDELLVGILTQIRLKSSQVEDRDHPHHQQWYESRGVVKVSMKARQMFTWLFGKEDSKFKNCENLHIL
ncbi:hypothetical protein Trydic_g16816 [Trypoxylus dichotomus]